MNIFDEMEKSGHEQLVFCQHKATGLRAVVAIHNTAAGPALGGCRMRDYESEDDMIRDALRLSRGMTYKCAIADVDHGGGKCVIWGDPAVKTPELFRALGRFVDGLGGRFYTGTDVGTMPIDFVHAHRETPYIVGMPLEYGGSGDSSIPTAYGVMQGIRATAEHLWGTQILESKTFAIQGLGKVGLKVAKSLVEEGAIVYGADVLVKNRDLALAEVPGIRLVGPDEILSTPCDILVPCALGGIINDHTISALNCKAVVGSANNQLEDEERHGRMLAEKGILYAPDYLVNAGGLIQVADELDGGNPERVLTKTNAIFQMLLSTYSFATENGLPTSVAANRLVEQRLSTVLDLRTIRKPIKR